MNSLQSKIATVWNKKLSWMQFYALMGTVDAGVVAYFVHDQSRKRKKPISGATIATAAIVCGAVWPYTVLLSVKSFVDETNRFITNS